MQNIRITKASLTHRDFIANAQLQMARETEALELNLDTVTQGVTHVLANPSLGFYAIAQDESGQSLGCCLVLKEWSDWRNTEVWWIHSVYVAEQARRRGVFSILYKSVVDWGRSEGAHAIRLYVDKRNTSAQRTYTAIGMNNEHYELFEFVL